MKRLAMIGLAAAVIAIAFLPGCSAPPAPEFGTVAIHMTDAPGGYDAVNLEILEVAAHRDGQGWEVLSDTPGMYDLNQLRNGVFTQLALATVPSGHYTQLRLKVGPASNVVVDGVPQPLVVPSGERTGYKLTGEFDVPPGGGMDVGLDFDAYRSIVVGGDGSYTLKPTTRVMPLEAAGAIRGRIFPTNTVAMVDVMQSGATVGSAQTADDGTFEVSILPAGVYDVMVRPVAYYLESSVPGVVVQSGATTDIGTVQLQSPE